MTHSKDQGSGQADCDDEYLGNCDIYIYRVKFTLTTNRKSCVGILLAYPHLILVHFKGHAHFDNEYLGNCDRYG